MKARDLRLVNSNPAQEFVDRTTTGLHLYNGVGRAERELDHFLREARKANYSEVIPYLETASDSLAEARKRLP